MEFCPYCRKKFEFVPNGNLKTAGLTAILIKPHTDCPPFIIFADPHGKIRGFQTVDAADVDNTAEFGKNIDKYNEIFTSGDPGTLFYHIKSRKRKSFDTTVGEIMAAKKTEYHVFMRSKFYRMFIKDFIENGSDFSLIYRKDIIISALNFYDMFIVVLGLEKDGIRTPISFQNLSDCFEFIKQKTVNMAEKIMDIIGIV